MKLLLCGWLVLNLCFAGLAAVDDINVLRHDGPLVCGLGPVNPLPWYVGIIAPIVTITVENSELTKRCYYAQPTK